MNNVKIQHFTLKTVVPRLGSINSTQVAGMTFLPVSSILNRNQLHYLINADHSIGTTVHRRSGVKGIFCPATT